MARCIKVFTFRHLLDFQVSTIFLLGSLPLLATIVTKSPRETHNKLRKICCSVPLTLGIILNVNFSHSHREFSHRLTLLKERRGTGVK